MAVINDFPVKEMDSDKVDVIARPYTGEIVLDKYMMLPEDDERNVIDVKFVLDDFHFVILYDAQPVLAYWRMDDEDDFVLIEEIETDFNPSRSYIETNYDKKYLIVGSFWLKNHAVYKITKNKIILIETIGYGEGPLSSIGSFELSFMSGINEIIGVAVSRNQLLFFILKNDRLEYVRSMDMLSVSKQSYKCIISNNNKYVLFRDDSGATVNNFKLIELSPDRETIVSDLNNFILPSSGIADLVCLNKGLQWGILETSANISFYDMSPKSSRHSFAFSLTKVTSTNMSAIGYGSSLKSLKLPDDNSIIVFGSRGIAIIKYRREDATIAKEDITMTTVDTVFTTGDLSYNGAKIVASSDRKIQLIKLAQVENEESAVLYKNKIYSLNI